MRREDIRDGGWWRLPGQPIGTWKGTKNGRDHMVWLSGPARALLDQHFAEQSRRRSELLLGRLWKKLQVEKIRPHDLRRTCLTAITRLGYSRDAMDRVANHTDTRVRSVYDRYGYHDEDRAMMEAVGRHVLRVAEGGEAKVIPLVR